MTPRVQDHLLTVLTLAFVTGLVLYPAMSYNELPAQVPVHFNASGTVDNFGNKGNIWILPILGLVTVIGLSVLNRFPHIFNYPVPVTEENAEELYQNATRMIRALTFTIAAGFFYIEYRSVNSALGNTSGLGSWFLPIFILGTGAPIVFFLVKSLRSKTS